MIVLGSYLYDSGRLEEVTDDGQCLAARLVDELRIHVAALVLGSGTPLFIPGERVELVQRSVRISSKATHLVYDVSRERKEAAPG